MTLDELKQLIEPILRGAGLQDEVLVESKLIGDIERLLLTRKLDSETRYLRITPVLSPDRTWDFEVLGGSYGNSDPSADFDGRRGGDGKYVADVLKRWLVDLANWNAIPSFESQQH